MLQIEKPSYNDEWRTLQFRRPDGAGQLGDAETVTACEVSCIERSTGTDRSAAMISEAAPYDQTQVRYRLKGGTRGTLYELTVGITTSTGQKLAEQLLLKVT
jgi:hypothetical protein